MQLSALTAVSPLDGRYRHTSEPLAQFFSEFAVIRYRILVEVEYFLALSDLGLPHAPACTAPEAEALRNIYRDFSLQDAQAIKDIERTTNHDVKAVEYFLKRWMTNHLGYADARTEFVHFGLTSQDVNNTAIPLAFRDFLHSFYIPLLAKVLHALESLALLTRKQPMLARTHGQPASPTVLGKEVFVFIERILNQRSLLQALPIPAKFGGATGNLNAHVVAFPAIDWDAFATHFVENALGGLVRSRTTTQVEHYDGLAALFDNLRRINVILIDLCRDFWQYIALNYFTQQVVAGEVGSSAMPHKVNPIDFENAEGNLGLANALLDHLSNKLPVSRLQRDLTDSTVLRNLGVPLGHTTLAFNSLLKGLAKLDPNPAALDADLDANWAVVAEAIQTILRREGHPKPYETLKALTRTGQPVDKATIQAFILSLELPEETRAELLCISPHNYVGIAG